jgi:hypothetical protein
VFEAKKEGVTTVGGETGATVSIAAASSTVVPYQLGDLNGDGKLDERDVREFIKVNRDISPSGRKPTANQIKAGDFNGDGKVGIADVQPFVDLMKSKGINVTLRGFLR